MRGLNNRVAALETGNGSELSPAAKAWLGQPLTDGERAALATDRPVDSRDIDTSTWSKELKAWLGIN